MTIERKKTHGIVAGVLILTAASLLVKVLGVVYKIPLSHLLGDEGMGYFNAAYTIYAWLYMLSTAGIPVALSIMISESIAGRDAEMRRKVVRIATGALLTIGIVSCTLMVLGARPLAAVLGTENARYSIIAIAPTLFFICISALFRGIFQGYRNMLPTAISQLIEAVGKVGCGILLALYAISRGYSLAIISAFAVAGVSIGTALGAVYLALHYTISRVRGQIDYRSEGEAVPAHSRIGRRMLTIALPVTISASVMSLTGLIDLGMMIRRLTAVGYTQLEATALYGNYTTLVVPVFNLPSIVVSPIATGIIPAVSAAYAGGRHEECKELIAGAFKAIGVISVPCAVGMCVFARPVLALLYPIESVVTAYKLLSLISPAVFFLCMLTVTNAVLQACGRPRGSMTAMLAGATVKVVAGYIVLGRFGIVGAPVGTVLCYVVALLVGLFVLARHIDYLPPITEALLKPLASALISVGGAGVLYFYLLVSRTPRIGVLVSVFVAVVLYFALSFLVGSVRREDVKKLLKNRSAGAE